MKNWLLILLLMVGCGSPAVVETDSPLDPESKVEVPDWRTDAHVAMICSRVSPENRYMVYSVMTQCLNNEYTSQEAKLTSFNDRISFYESDLMRTILEAPINSETEENYIYYCAEGRIQLELLRLQRAHYDELRRLMKAVKTLAQSLEDLERDSSHQQR